MALNVNTLAAFVEGLSYLELKTVDEKVKARLLELQRRAIRPGQVVSFMDRAGGLHHMTVERINHKSIGGTEVGTSRS